jgi:hypothetical protein
MELTLRSAPQAADWTATELGWFFMASITDFTPSASSTAAK